jgi:hypothetical protein
MPDFPSGYVWQGGACDALYWRYCIRCHVEQENDKAYYWPQMEQIFDLLQPLIAGWQDCRIRADQALERRIGKMQDRGTFENAPVGGLQKLTRERLRVVSTKYLAANEHLVARFRGDNVAADACFTAAHPRRVHFFLTEILAHRKRLKHDASIAFLSLPHDLLLRVGGYDAQNATKAADPINQSLDLYIWQGVMPLEDANALARALGKIAFAKQIWKVESGYIGPTYIDDEGYQRNRYWLEDRVEDAVEGRNRYGALWIDLLALAETA